VSSRLCSGSTGSRADACSGADADAAATAVPGGYVAVATQSAEAAFDNIVVTQP